MFNDAVFINDVSGTNETNTDFSENFLFFPNLILDCCVTVFIREENKRETFFLGELLVGFFLVLADSNNYCVLFLKLSVKSRKGCCLTGTAGRSVTRVEIEDNFFSTEVCERYHVPVFVREREGRGCDSWF